MTTIIIMESSGHQSTIRHAFQSEWPFIFIFILVLVIIAIYFFLPYFGIATAHY